MSVPLSRRLVLLCKISCQIGGIGLLLLGWLVERSVEAEDLSALLF